jgi:DNA topoisomerase-2
MMLNDENVVPKNKAAKSSKSKKTIEETYTKKTQLEHILLRPDTYIGSVDKQVQQLWVYDKATKQIVHRQVNFVPGLYKIFDEIIVNAADNKQRDPTMSKIEVTINEEEGFIRVWNNGSGIPVVVHQEHQIYVPELIFGNLLTGSNFDDEEAKTTGGRNGFGSKLANIFSTKFIIETADSSRGLKYNQTFTNNMQDKTQPAVTKFSGTDYTCVTFYPDLKRFKMDCLDEDIVALLSKRVHDVAGTNTASGAKLNVYLNGARIEAKNFEQYISMYQGIEAPVAFERFGDRWEIGVGVSDGTFQQVSFVNSISTTKGGCHVNYIADQITAKLSAVVKKKNKEEVKPNQIKNHLAVYINALIVNPAFDSQTKENLTTKASNFGSTCTVSDKMMKLIEKSGIVDNILSWAKFKQSAELKKKGGSKKSKLIGITKLDDANFAGTSKSKDCTMILTEGDSAKAFAISGLGVVGRDYYGVFPLKGKLLNVREAPHAQLMKNEEIQNIAKILGLTFGKKYEDTKELRYGHLMIMTDQDHDGSHIKGLLINFIHHFWPSLLKIDGFLQQFITPIVKCSKGKKEEVFYTIPEYNTWRHDQNEGKGWKIKYYKGLGTSTSAEAKEYFSNLQTHELDFKWDDKADDVIDMAFAKKRVDDRKLWLLGLKPGVHIDYTAETISYDNFVNHELILFSHADNERSIPSFMDGLKPSQRKVLFSCFKRNLKQEIKVAQLAGYVSEHSAYHHGEASLTQTIIGMAQNYVGSNNINLLSPCGQFGTRLMGGKDAASPRYVFTKLEGITRCIFHPHDDPLLDYLEDDGQSIEPQFYVPVIPMALVNGSDGIGTGWSTNVPTFDPREIISNLKGMIRGDEPAKMNPWYRGFTGVIAAKTGSANFSATGIINQEDESTVLISELQIGMWTTNYKQYLESVLIGGAALTEGVTNAPFIKDFKENHTDTTVSFTVTLAPEKLMEISEADGGLVKKFKLETSIATSNMNMFDLNSQIRKFENTSAILKDFFKVRLEYYDRRKVHLTEKLTEEWEKLDNKMRFIMEVIEGTLVVSNRKKADLLQDLSSRGYKCFYTLKAPTVVGEGGEVDTAEDASPTSLDKGYDYLLSMKIWSLTKEKVEEMRRQRDGKRDELDALCAMSAERLWEDDLDALEIALGDYEAAIDDEKKEELAQRKKATNARGNKQSSSKGASSRAKKVAPKPKKKAYSSDDDSDGDAFIVDDDDSDFEATKPSKKDKAPSKATTTATSHSSSAAAQKKATASTSTSTTSSTSSAAASKATATTKAAAEKKVTALTKVLAPIVPEEMSLFERLKAKKSAAAAVGNSSITSFFPPSQKGTDASSSSSINLCDSDDEGPAKVVATKAKAPARKKAASKVVDSDDDDEEFDFERAVAPIVKPVAIKAKGVKRAPKGSASSSAMSSPAPKKASREEEFSPGDNTPKPLKKSRTTAATKKAPAAVKAPAATKVAAPAKKAVASKKKIVYSEDEDEDAFSGEDCVVVEASPKALRARPARSAVASYKFDESEEEEEESDEEEDDEEFSD